MLLALGAAFYGLRNRLFGTALAEFISRVVARESGISLNVERVSGSWIRDLTLHGVRVRGTDGAPWLPSATADSLAFRYSISRFLRRHPMPLLSLSASGLRATIDAAGPPAERTERPAPFLPPTVLPAIEIRDADIEILGPWDHSARLAGVTFLSHHSGNGYDLQFACRRITLLRADDPRFAFGAAVSGSYDGRALRISTLRVNEDPVDTDAVVVWDESGSIEVAWDIRSPESVLPISSEGTMRNGVVETTVRTRRLRAATVLAPFLPDADTFPDGDCDLALSFRGMPADVSSWDASLYGEIHNVCAGPIRFHHVEVEARFREDTLAVPRLVLEQPGNRLELRDARVPVAGKDLQSLVGSLSGRWAAEGTELTSLLGLGTAARVRPLLPPYRAEFEGTFGDGVVRIDGGRVEVPYGHAQISGARLRPRWAAPNRLEDVDLDQADIALLVAGIERIPGLPDLAPVTGRADAHIVLEGTVRRPTAHATILAEDLHLRTFALGAVSAEVSWQPGMLRAEEIVATAPDWFLRCSGSADLEAKVLDRLALDAAVFDAAGLSLPGILGGTGEIHAEISGPIGAPVGSVEVAGESLRTRYVDFDSIAASLRAEGPRVLIDRADLIGTFGALHAEGEIERDNVDQAIHARLDRLRLESDELQLSLAAPAEMTFAQGLVAIPRVRMTGPDGEVAIALLRRPDLSEVEIELDNVEIRPFVPFLALRTEASGRLSGRFRLENRSSSISWDGELELAALRLADDERAFDVALTTSGAEGRAVLRQFEIRSGEQVWASLAGEAPFDPSAARPLAEGDLAIRGSMRIPDIAGFPLPLPAPFEGLRGTFAADADLAGTTSEVLGDLLLSGENLEWSVDAAGVGSSIGPGTARVRLRATPTGIDISATGQLGGKLDAHAEGTIAGSLDLREIAARGFPSLLARPLDLAYEISSTELDGLLPAAGPVRRLTGALEMRGRAGGAMDAPSLNGSIRWQNGSLRLAALPASFRQLELDAAFDGWNVRFERAEGEVAGAPFSLAGFVNLNPSDPVADLTLNGNDLLLARGDGLQLRADTEVRLVGDAALLRLSGDVTVRDSWYRKDFRPADFLERGRRPRSAPRRSLFSFTKPPLSDMQFDVRINAEEPFRIDTNLARLRLRAQLTLSGTGRFPKLAGVIYVDPGHLVLPSGRLGIDSGVAAVEEADPLVPRIDVQGSARMYGYDVNLQANGPYDDPEILLSSSPPLTQEELLFMLVTGTPPTTGNPTTQSGQVAANLLLYFGGTQLPRWLGAGEGSSGQDLMDRLEVEMGREASGSGTRSVEMSLRLYPPDPFLAPYAYYLTAEQDIYRRINMGLRWVRRLR